MHLLLLFVLWKHNEFCIYKIFLNHFIQIIHKQNLLNHQQINSENQM